MAGTAPVTPKVTPPPTYMPPAGIPPPTPPPSIASNAVMTMPKVADPASLSPSPDVGAAPAPAPATAVQKFDDPKQSRNDAIVQGLSGMASAALSAALQPDSPEMPESKSSIPGGNPSSIGHSSAPYQLHAGRMNADVSPRQSLAMAMLKGGA